MTPEPRNILRGISRAYVLELAARLGVAAEERNIEPYDVMAADEAFITGTPFCMLPVTAINAVQIGAGRRGPVFDRLLEAWGAEVGLDIEAQLREYERDVAAGSTPYQFKG